ncbi:MAG: carbonic anhydrase family protein [Saprospiraceae bacterium]|nr:carbonic anhydrase family protein [Saprospiraceae bacterium]
MKTIQQLLPLMAFTILVNACKSDEKEIPTDCTGLHWTYDSGEEGPAHWGEICTGYSDCKGSAQSPINMVNAATDASLTAITKTYNTSTVHILNNGHTLYFSYDSTSLSSITYGGMAYSLLQFHTHTPSEHTIDGKSYPLEIHFVHKNATTGKLAVIGVMFSEGAENVTLAKFVGNLPTKTDGKYDLATDNYTATDLMPTSQSYYTYAGSLTTPPCSETVTWLVMKTPMTASAAQIAAFKNIESSNNRPIQSLNGRILKVFN